MSNPQFTFAAAARIDASQEETDAANAALFAFADAAADQIIDAEQQREREFDELRAALPPAHFREFSAELLEARHDERELADIIRRWHQMSIQTTILINSQLQAIIRANLGIDCRGSITAKRGERIMRTDAPINMLCRLLTSERVAWDHSRLAGVLWEMGFRASRAIQLSNNHALDPETKLTIARLEENIRRLKITMEQGCLAPGYVANCQKYIASHKAEIEKLSNNHKH